MVIDGRDRSLFSEQKRLIVKTYPEGAGSLLEQAGFSREMKDYVLYW